MLQLVQVHQPDMLGHHPEQRHLILQTNNKSLRRAPQFPCQLWHARDRPSCCHRHTVILLYAHSFGVSPAQPYLTCALVGSQHLWHHTHGALSAPWGLRCRWGKKLEEGTMLWVAAVVGGGLGIVTLAGVLPFLPKRIIAAEAEADRRCAAGSGPLQRMENLTLTLKLT